MGRLRHNCCNSFFQECVAQTPLGHAESVGSASAGSRARPDEQGILLCDGPISPLRQRYAVINESLIIPALAKLTRA